MQLLFNTNLKHLTNRCGVYIIYINSHTYVGSSINIASRLIGHRSKLRSNKHRNAFMQNCFNKYGQTDTHFKILSFCTKDERLQIERDFILQHQSDLNLVKDPTTQFNTPTTSKTVYQYSLSGDFIAEFESCNEAERQLNIVGIACAANPKLTAYKSIGGFL